MTARGLELHRLTVQAPTRRVDICVPATVPLGEVLPQLLRAAGPGLADTGAAHGGWVVRRADGRTLPVDADLHHLGVRDGEVLFLAPAGTDWPEPEYDDVVDAVAAGARRAARGWDPTVTAVVTRALAGSGLALGLLAVVREPAPAAGGLALGISGVLLLCAMVAARAYRDTATGVLLGGWALGYAAAGGLLALPMSEMEGTGLVAAAATLLVASVLGAIMVGHGLRVFVAGGLVALLAAAGAMVSSWLNPASAAALVLSVLLLGSPVLPLAAVRLGRVPVPVPAPPTAVPEDTPPPQRAAVFAAVVRTDEVLTGLLLGCGLVTAVAVVPVQRFGGLAGTLLAAVCASALLLRARLFTAVRQRLALLLAGAASWSALLVSIGWSARGRLVVALPVGLVLFAIVVLGVGGAYRHRRPGPYLGRAADLIDLLCVVSAAPLAAAVLGLYGEVRGVFG